MSFRIIPGSKITPRLTGQHVFTTARGFSFVETFGAFIALAATAGVVLAILTQ